VVLKRNARMKVFCSGTESDMTAVDAQKLILRVDGANAVSALLLQPPRARACFVLAHGAGAG
jgi:hypothetical protein